MGKIKVTAEIPAGKGTYILLPTGSVGETDEAVPEAITAAGGLLNRPDTLQDTQLDAIELRPIPRNSKNSKTTQSKKEGLPALPGHGRNEGSNQTQAS